VIFGLLLASAERSIFWVMRVSLHASAYGVLFACVTTMSCSDPGATNGGQGGAAATSGQSSGGANPTSGGTSTTSGGSSGGTSAGTSSTSGGASAGGSGTTGGATGMNSGGTTSGGAGVTGGANATGGASVAGSGGTVNGGSGSGGTAGAAGGGKGGASGQAGAGAEGGGKAEVHWVGRMDFSDAKGPRFAWSGSGAVARFNGTQVGVTVSSGQYTVLVDGQLRPKLVGSSAVQSLATGLAAGPHTVEIYRRTEANQGESQFLGFDFGSGTLLPPPLPTRRLEVVGDSISCGYGVEGANATCPFSADTENHYLSYEALAARAVSAELVTIAWSGKGAFCNYGDDATSCVDPMPTYYERALPNRSDSAWDFQKWQADAVVINLGTNDFSTNQDPTKEQFEGAYTALIKKIRSKYANAWILCTNGTMLTGTDLTTVRGYIQNVVTTLSAAGDAKLKSFELTPQAAADGYGCDYHPSKATHVKMADQLTAVLKSTLGW
jgi:hypothetical protein